MFNWFKNDDTDDRYTIRDFKITVIIFFVLIALWNIGGLYYDKLKCAYKGYTYEKDTKRPIFSECLIQMKDGSFVPMERYINRVLTFNDLGSEN